MKKTIVIDVKKPSEVIAWLEIIEGKDQETFTEMVTTIF